MIFAKSIFALLASGAQSSEQEKVALIQLPNQELLAVDVDKPLRASLLSAGLTAKASVDATAKASVDASGEITLKTQGSTGSTCPMYYEGCLAAWNQNGGDDNAAALYDYFCIEGNPCTVCSFCGTATPTPTRRRAPPTRRRAPPTRRRAPPTRRRAPSGSSSTGGVGCAGTLAPPDQVNTISDVHYGSAPFPPARPAVAGNAWTTATPAKAAGENMDLKFDVYCPCDESTCHSGSNGNSNVAATKATCDTDTWVSGANKRTAMVYVHGGYFSTGSTKEGSASWGNTAPRYFAVRGMYTVSIEYRRMKETCDGWAAETPSYQCYPDASGRIDMAVTAAEDFKAAVRFLRKHATTLKIDPNKIATHGCSAGSITITTAAFNQYAGEGSSGNSGYTSDVAATVALSGVGMCQSYMKSGLNSDSTAYMTLMNNEDSVLDPYPVCWPQDDWYEAANQDGNGQAQATKLHASLTSSGVENEHIQMGGNGHCPNIWASTSGSYKLDSVMELIADKLGLTGTGCR